MDFLVLNFHNNVLLLVEDIDIRNYFHQQINRYHLDDMVVMSMDLLFKTKQKNSMNIFTRIICMLLGTVAGAVVVAVS